jgi:hypothetical protein
MPERGVICGRLPTGASRELCSSLLLQGCHWLSTTPPAEGVGCLFSERDTHTHTRSSMQSGGSRLISAGSRRRSRRARGEETGRLRGKAVWNNNWRPGSATFSPLFLRPTRRLWLAASADSSQGRRANQVSSGASKRLSWPAPRKKTGRLINQWLAGRLGSRERRRAAKAAPSGGCERQNCGLKLDAGFVCADLPIEAATGNWRGDPTVNKVGEAEANERYATPLTKNIWAPAGCWLLAQNRRLAVPQVAHCQAIFGPLLRADGEESRRNWKSAAPAPALHLTDDVGWLLLPAINRTPRIVSSAVHARMQSARRPNRKPAQPVLK